MTDQDHIRVMLDDGTRGEITQLYESQDAWGFGGGLWISKDKGLFRTDGDGALPLHADCHFERVRFDLPEVGARGVAGWALFFRQYRTDAPARAHRGERWYLAGWVPVSRGDEIAAWVDRLNAAIERQVRRLAPASRADARASSAAEAEARVRGSAALLKAAGLDVPGARSIDDLVDKIEEMARNGPVDLRGASAATSLSTDDVPMLINLEHSADEVIAGALAVWRDDRRFRRPRDFPTYRFRGELYRLPDDAAFIARSRLRPDGSSVLTIVLRTADREIPAAWSPATKAKDVESCVSYLNRQLDAARRHHAEQLEIAARYNDVAMVRPLESGVGPHAIVFEQGHEYAPEARSGLHRVRVTTDGRLYYLRRRRGTDVRAIGGRVDGTKVSALLKELDRTTFPRPPHLTFLPGAGMMSIAVEPLGQCVKVERSYATQIDGYRDAIEALEALNDALHQGDAEVLGAWRFVPEGGE